MTDLCNYHEVTMNDFIPFKTSSATVTVVVLPDSNLSIIEQAIAEKMKTTPLDFFTAQPVAVDISNLKNFALDINWLRTLKRLFSRYKLCLIGVIGEAEEKYLLAAELTSITINEPKIRPAEKIIERVIEKPVTISVPMPVEHCKIVRNPIRSGQQIYAQNADLIVIGAVGAGAEIYADGNIHVYGMLRGRAFAGVRTNNTSAFIYCHEFAAELVSIAGFYQDMEQLTKHEGQKNVFISLNEDETMKIESLS